MEMSNTTIESYLSTFDFTIQNTISELSTGRSVSNDGHFLTNVSRATGMVPVHTPTYIYVWISVVNVVIFVAGFLGNMMVILAVAKVKNMRTPTNFCLVNLSMADVLVLGVCQTSAFLEFFAEDKWLLGRFLCRVIPFLELLFTHASILIMLGVSFGRYYAVCRPLQSYSTCGRGRTLVMMSCMWGVAAIFSVPMVIIAHIETATFHRDASLIEVCRTHIFLNWHYAYVICIFCVFFVIPFFVMLFIYSSIIHGVLRESAHIEENANTKSFRRKSLRNQRQIVCMLFVIVVVFFLCTLPLRIVIFWFAFTDEKHIQNLGLEGYLNLIWCGRVLQYLNSAINPIIYSAFSTKFRWAFKYILGMEKRQDYSWSRTSQRTSASAHYSYIKQSKQREQKEQYM